jgi:hypothetical protein
MRGTPALAAQDREPSQVCRLGGRQSLQELKTSHLSQLCQQCATPFSNSSLYYHHSAARIAENGFATSSSVSKSAKVVLGRELINRDRSPSYD